MSALALVALAFCVAPADQTAGWKHTPLPAEAPALAAPEEVEQFRTGEPALVLDREARFAHAAEPHVGKLVLRFAVPPGSQHLRVRFAQRLDGMEVDARAVDGAGRAMLLLDGRRLGGDEVRLDWGPADVARVEVTLRHHLRARPVVAEWRAGRWERVSELPGLQEAFRTPGTLSWRHPGGRRIELCDAPGQRLTVWGADFAASGAER